MIFKDHIGLIFKLKNEDKDEVWFFEALGNEVNSYMKIILSLKGVILRDWDIYEENCNKFHQ